MKLRVTFENVHGEWVRLEEVLSVIDRRIEELNKSKVQCLTETQSAYHKVSIEELESLKAELKGSDSEN